MATSNEDTALYEMVGPIAFEFGIGVAEGLQHGVPAAKRASTYIGQTFFNRAPEPAITTANDAHLMQKNK